MCVMSVKIVCGRSSHGENRSRKQQRGHSARLHSGPRRWIHRHLPLRLCRRCFFHAHWYVLYYIYTATQRNNHSYLLTLRMCIREAWWRCTRRIVCCGRRTCTCGGRHDLRRTHIRWPPEPRRDHWPPCRRSHHRLPFHPLLDWSVSCIRRSFLSTLLPFWRTGNEANKISLICLFLFTVFLFCRQLRFIRWPLELVTVKG